MLYSILEFLAIFGIVMLAIFIVGLVLQRVQNRNQSRDGSPNTESRSEVGSYSKEAPKGSDR